VPKKKYLTNKEFSRREKRASNIVPILGRRYNLEIPISGEGEENAGRLW